ncbi:MAG: PTS transporter subunit EIIB [Bacillales bacterium]|jgi:phosphotransferase system IIB component|nr:PTS transporter subunit EIIB [Bacillales bacterium]
MDFILKYWYIFVSLLVLIVLLILFIIYKIRKNKNNKTTNDLFAQILNCLGGRDNIIKYEQRNSRLQFLLKDYNINKDKLKELGINGIVVNSDKVTLVIGSKADLFAKYIH